jgi:GNAT superfamily N-acetyltransferase
MIRHKLPFLYAILDLLNKIYGHIFFRGFKRSLSQHTWEGVHPNDTVEILTERDIPLLLSLTLNASEESKSFFKPHAMTDKTFLRLMRAPYYIAVGYKKSGELVGYAFLRLYFPEKAFAGYFVSDIHQGKGIGKYLFRIIKSISNETAFALYTYVKEDNHASMHVSSDFIIEQRMPGGYLLLKHVDKK